MRWDYAMLAVGNGEFRSEEDLSFFLDMCLFMNWI